jgi:methionyl aminopeptidase
VLRSHKSGKLSSNIIIYLFSKYVTQNGYKSCPEFAGHGVGKQLHMTPCIMHTYGNPDQTVMEEGMAFTIEPIVLMHPYEELYMWEDEWTVISPDNPSAQWEHTILITKYGHEILTLREGEKIV